MTGEELEGIDQWIQALRHDLERGDQDHKFEGLRAETMFYRVIQKIERERARGSWMQRLRRTIGMIFSIGSVVWR